MQHVVNEISGIEQNEQNTFKEFNNYSPERNNKVSNENKEFKSSTIKMEDQNASQLMPNNNHSHSTYNYDQDEIRKLLQKYDNAKKTDNSLIEDNNNIVNSSPKKYNNEPNYNYPAFKNNYLNNNINNINKDLELKYSYKNNKPDSNDLNNINNDINAKLNNLSSLESAMKGLNDVLEFSSKSSLKNRYEFNLNSNKREIDVISSSLNKNTFQQDHELDNSELVDLNVLNKVIKNDDYENYDKRVNIILY